MILDNFKEIKIVSGDDMNYKIYKLKFSTGVHFGDGMLNDSMLSLKADTFFSSLCIESIKMGCLDKLIDFAKKRKFVLSDLFPYVDDKLLIPKPNIYIEPQKTGDSIQKKKAKKLKYIAIDDLGNYLNGEIDKVDSYMDKIGEVESFTKVNLTESIAKPFHVGITCYNKNSGLYIILGFEDAEIDKMISDLMLGLSVNGIGGKKYSGLGKFDFYTQSMPSELLKRIENFEKYDKKMSLSVSLPEEKELKTTLINSSYSLEKRSGFIYSLESDNNTKKKDLFVFSSGSCFENCYKGDIYDVSNGVVNHPVYRYAIPMFMGVK